MPKGDPFAALLSWSLVEQRVRWLGADTGKNYILLGVSPVSSRWGEGGGCDLALWVLSCLEGVDVFRSGADFLKLCKGFASVDNCTSVEAPVQSGALSRTVDTLRRGG